jgi:crotonobetainyl-CoA:carnitine CoA-transferase CaiB-like acyl-CoA transferase
MDGPLSGVRVVEVAMFAPDATGMHLADLGAEVIKVEEPGIGDPARFLGRPYRGEAPATRRWNRGKRSVVLDLRAPDGVAVFRDLVATSDAVIEGMRPGSLARRGVGFDDLLPVNPRLVYVAVSGWGIDGPYRDLASHGLAFDAFAGLADPRLVDGRPTRPLGHVWHGIESGPLHAALALLAGVVRARATGKPSFVEVSEADSAAVWNGWRIAHDAAVAEHGEEPGDEAARDVVLSLRMSAEGAGRTGPDDLTATDVRYQYYRASDGHVLLMATETKFWERFCTAVGRPDLFARWPGRPHADHDYGNEELRDELAAIFATRTRAEWVELFVDANVAGAPVYVGGETHADPHFRARDLAVDADTHGLAILGSPIRVDGRRAVAPRAAPRFGDDTDVVLRDVLGYDDGRVAALRAAGVLGR